MRTKIKICGLSRDIDASYVNAALPDFAGFIISFPKSRRSIAPERAKQFRELIDSRIKTVGVFVNSDLHEAASLANCGAIDVIQLHGSESEEYISSLRRETSAEIWKSFIVKTEGDISAAASSSADRVLLDGGMGGGTLFDHSLIKNIGREFILAGGLNCGNIENAVKTLRPWAVDISSGVETDGVKDRSRIVRITAMVRSSDLLLRQ